MDNGENRATVKAIVKDINSQLPFGKKLEVTGKSALLLSKDTVNKVKNWYQVKKDKLEGYVSQEIKDLKKKERQKITEKINKGNEIWDKINDLDTKTLTEFTMDGSRTAISMDALAERLYNLEEKRKNISGQKVGLFRMSTLALKKISSEKIQKVQEKRAQRKQDKEAKKQRAIEEAAKQEKLNNYKRLLDEKGKLEDRMSQLQEMLKNALEQQKELNDKLVTLGKEFGVESPELEPFTAEPTLESEGRSR